MNRRRGRPEDQPLGRRAALVARIQQQYVRLRPSVAMACLILALVFVYGRDVLAPIAPQLLPVVIGIFAFINFETLLELVGDGETRPPWEYRTLSDAVPRMTELVAGEPDHVRLGILAASGYSTMKDVLPRLLDAAKSDRIRAEVSVVARTTAVRDHLPPNWEFESATVVKDLYALCARRRNVDAEIREYDHLPCIHGVLINESHLFIGFAGWRSKLEGKEFSAGNRPHRYFFKTDPGAKHYFFLFNDWYNNAPSSVAAKAPQRPTRRAQKLSHSA
jgi:hypothetical protein